MGQDAPPPLESLDRHTHEVWTGVDKKRGADVGADDLHRVGTRSHRACSTRS